MLKPNPPGRPKGLTDELIKRIVSFVPNNLVMSQVARLSCIPIQTLHRWIKKGEKDAIRGLDTLYAQLWEKYEQKKGESIQDILVRMKSLDSYQAYSFLLERGDPKVFAPNAEVLEKLEKQQNKILKLFKGETVDVQALSDQKGLIENENKNHEGRQEAG